MHQNGPKFRGLYLFVDDMKSTLAFYELLGLTIEKVNDEFARAVWVDNLFLEFGTSDITKSYDPNWQPPQLPATNTISLEYEENEQVDRVYALVSQAGYDCHLKPTTPPWQSRFCILLDPNGNFVGLHGPREIEDDRSREA